MLGLVSSRLDRYRRDGIHQVQGWFDVESAEVMAVLLCHQVESGVTGGVAEIGVHHGRSFLLLANGLREGEVGVALDVFEDQERNTDRSGLGDRARFEANLLAHAPEAEVRVVAASSLDVTPATARETFGEARMFSVDGGHTAEITRHDLTVAEAAVAERGVVVLDDLLNGHWLGVLTGTSDYLRGGGGLVPFAYSANKLYLAPSTAVAAEYAAHLRRALPDLLGKRDVEFFAATIDIYGQGSPRRHRTAAEARADELRRVRQAEAAERKQDRQRDKLRGERRLRRELADELAQARAEVQALRSSTSWRLTGWVRWLGALGRRSRRTP